MFSTELSAFLKLFVTQGTVEFKKSLLSLGKYSEYLNIKNPFHLRSLQKKHFIIKNKSGKVNINLFKKVKIQKTLTSFLE